MICRGFSLLPVAIPLPGPLPDTRGRLIFQTLSLVVVCNERRKMPRNNSGFRFVDLV
jgi:hypothetical protein